jgi:hypothetical protein
MYKGKVKPSRSALLSFDSINSRKAIHGAKTIFRLTSDAKSSRLLMSTVKGLSIKSMMRI